MAEAVECPRCEHLAEFHWKPGSTEKTSACIVCLKSKKETVWVIEAKGEDGHPLVRDGICDHTAEWVNNPW